ncbi:cytidylyltransferase domain-containing protein [Tumebacillus permanentifrigoris]|uniref:Spore coat polysaccharide biosynthesis protein SpsF n=1 Tax=Tumebacillus permanentifrigoris TaxID=378543 RepID=A0A316DD74_9BACL|nr:glycosyltransferase family protein [Tumebacillus permanentifrigoris]PWK16177.1 spore coat polysaccharide biosynthesis protein SpsF [Tumebacillus permanentifrigoris]
MKRVVIVQARMGSSRLPGKVMLDLMGKPVLAHVIERCQSIAQIDEVVIATTENPSDDVLVHVAEHWGVTCTRGSEDDVLSRYYQAARASQADVVMRVTSDCPFLDPSVSGAVLQQLLSNPHLDYVSNGLVCSYPRGLDTEAFTFAALEKAYQEATLPFEREHVTPYLYQNPQIFQLASHENAVDYSQYRWTLDTPEDWELISQVYQGLYRPGEIFSWQQGIQFMEQHPELRAINAHIEQKKLGE